MERRRPGRRSSLPYLILNVFISALTTLLVLWLWGRFQSAKLPEQSNFNFPGVTEPVMYSDGTDAAPHPLPPIETPAIQILNVFGAGDINNEVVMIKNILNDQEIWLDGWELRNENGSSYKFNSVVLNPGAQTQVFSKAGFDSVTSLYWGLVQPVWQPGETVSIIDYEGNIRATFEIP